MFGTELRNISKYSRIVAVDLHGDFNQIIRILRHTKIINDNDEWIGNNTILVQTIILIF